MRPPRTVAQPLRLPPPDSSGRSGGFGQPGLRLAAMWGRLLGAPSGSGRLAIAHPSEARTSFRLTPAPAPAPATPAAAGGLLRRIFPSERQCDICRVLLLIHLEVRLGSPEPLEHPLFLDPIQKIIGILRIQRLACLQRPDARDLRLAVQIQPHDG